MNDNERKPKDGVKGSDGLKLTAKEEEIMCLLWSHGPLFVKEMVELMPQPRPHVNTVSTVVRGLESKGFVSHESYGGSHRYQAVMSRGRWCRNKFGSMVKRYFNNSYMGMVSALVEDERLSVGELREIIDIIEEKSNSKKK